MKIDKIFDAILLIIIIAQSIYISDMYKHLEDRVDNLSRIISNIDGDVNSKMLKELNLDDNDIEKILNLVYNGKKVEAIKLLNEIKGIDHMEAYRIISQLTGEKK